LEKILTTKFNARESWKDFADRHQPDDNVRYMMALLEFPDGKRWSVQDLENSGYLQLGSSAALQPYSWDPDSACWYFNSHTVPRHPRVCGGQEHNTASNFEGPKKKEIKESL
jgi:hypothetical protein